MKSPLNVGGSNKHRTFSARLLKDEKINITFIQSSPLGLCFELFFFRDYLTWLFFL